MKTKTKLMLVAIGIICGVALLTEAKAQVDPRYDAFGGYRPQGYQPSALENFIQMQNNQMQPRYHQEQCRIINFCQFGECSLRMICQ